MPCFHCVHLGLLLSGVSGAQTRTSTPQPTQGGLLDSLQGKIKLLTSSMLKSKPWQDIEQQHHALTHKESVVQTVVHVPAQKLLGWTAWQGPQRRRLSRRAPPGAQTPQPPGCASQTAPPTPHGLQGAMHSCQRPDRLAANRGPCKMVRCCVSTGSWEACWSVDDVRARPMQARQWIVCLIC